MNDLDSSLSGNRKARIEIIPLIDVIFFLLATFVLFTLSLQKIRSVDLQFPVPGQKGEADATVFIQVSAEGTFYWKQGSNGVAELISAAELRPRLENYRRSTPTPRVFIRSDRAAKFGAGVMVLDEVRRVKISEVSVETFSTPPGS
jgi:biopolymer transport protein ExbD